MKGWLCGPTYQTWSKQAGSERCINLWPQTRQSPRGKSQCVLMPAPGLRSFATLTDRPVRGLFSQNGRCFAVGGSTLFQVHANGTITSLGSVHPSGDPAVFAGNGDRGHQVMVVSGGKGAIYNTSTSTLTAISDAQFPASVITCGYGDGYFLAITPDRFGISVSLDGTNWAGDEGQRIGAPEAIRGGLLDQEVVWLFGSQRTEVWYNSGASFPYEPIPGVFLEVGLGAAHAVTRVGDSLVWLVEDERGGRMVVRNQQYNAVPVSTAGVDAMLTDLASVADARMFSYQLLGHTFAVLTIPSGELTLQYDVTEDAWSELAYWNGVTGRFEAARAGCHAYAFGKHLVGDRETGAIHELTMSAYDDAGELRRWVRRSGHLHDENRMIFHQELELHAEMGVGLASGQGSNPLVQMRYSDDGGFTWSNWATASLGAQGVYDARARWFLLGSSRNRVYEFAGTDPVKTVLVDAYLRAAIGTW